MRIHPSLATPMLWLALACVGQAAASPQTAQATQAAQVPRASAPPGLTVVRDAETGELRAPTAAEYEALQVQPATPAARRPQPTLVTGADGREGVHLGSSRLVYSVVGRGPDGKVDYQCIDGADGVHSHLNHGAPSGAQEKARNAHR